MRSGLTSVTNAARFTLYAIGLLVLSAYACQQPFDFPPRPTPFPLAEINAVELDKNHPPSDLFGHSYVTRGPTGEIYIVNIETGETRKLTSDGRRKRGRVISERYMAWIEYHNPSKLSDRAASSDVFALDLETGIQRRITDVTAMRSGLSIYGHRVVWSEDRRQETGSDIYAYDLESNKEIPITVAPRYQGEPDIHENLVVWTDGRNSPNIGTPQNLFTISLRVGQQRRAPPFANWYSAFFRSSSRAGDTSRARRKTVPPPIA